MIYLSRLNKSFRHAFRGFRLLFFSEQSFRLQVLAAALILLLSSWLKISIFEWLIVTFLIGCVLTLEIFNSILERIVDTFKPRIHPVVRDIKDMTAAAVFVFSLVAAIVGVVIFLPRLIALF